MEAGLIDALIGHFLDGQVVADGNPAMSRIASVVDNLTRLFNTRRGSIAHLPDYGLPDISQVYRELPFSIDGLRSAIREVVEKYEPRLRRVRVEIPEKEKDEERDERLSFIVMGELLRGQKVQFQTTFSSSDLARVHARTRQT